MMRKKRKRQKTRMEERPKRKKRKTRKRRMKKKRREQRRRLRRPKRNLGPLHNLQRKRCQRSVQHCSVSLVLHFSTSSSTQRLQLFAQSINSQGAACLVYRRSLKLLAQL